MLKKDLQSDQLAKEEILTHTRDRNVTATMKINLTGNYKTVTGWQSQEKEL